MTVRSHVAKQFPLNTHVLGARCTEVAQQINSNSHSFTVTLFIFVSLFHVKNRGSVPSSPFPQRRSNPADRSGGASWSNQSLHPRASVERQQGRPSIDSSHLNPDEGSSAPGPTAEQLYHIMQSTR